MLSCLTTCCLALCCLVLSCLVSYLILSCLVLSCLVFVLCLVLFCLASSRLVLPCLVWPCLVCLLLSDFVLFCFVLSRLVSSCFVQSRLVLVYLVLFSLQSGESEGGYLLTSCLVSTKAGQHEQAMAYFDRAIEVCPDGFKSHDFHCKKAEVLQAMCCCLSCVSLHLGLLFFYVFVCAFEPFGLLYLLQY